MIAKSREGQGGEAYSATKAQRHLTRKYEVCVCKETSETGEVPEWSIGAVSKTVVRLLVDRGFESHPLRFCW